jgi:hypothetical protein
MVMTFISDVPFVTKTTLVSAFSVVGVAGIAFRFWYYMQRRLLLYFLDLCYYVWWCSLYTLWLSPSEPSWWHVAVYLSTTGPVGGANLMLQQALLVHHPEAFESHFLHNAGMWLGYAMRWRLMADAASSATSMSVGTLVGVGLKKVYAPWAAGYLLFLLAKPYLPAISTYETLFDWYVGAAAGASTGGSSAEPFRQYWWTSRRRTFSRTRCSRPRATPRRRCASNTSRSISRGWRASSSPTSSAAGHSTHYRASADPSYETPNKLVAGLKDSAYACMAVMLPVYWASAYYECAAAAKQCASACE